MQKNPLKMTLTEIESALEMARRRVRKDAVRALGSETAVAGYERLRRRSERIGPEGDAAFDTLWRFEQSLTDRQRRLLFGDRRDPRLDPDELEEVRRAFEPALIAEQPADLFPELRRNLPRVRPGRLKALTSLSGADISRNLSEIVSAIRVREALVRLRAFGVSGAGILNGVLQDFQRQGGDAEDARFMLHPWSDSVGQDEAAGVGSHTASGTPGQQGERTWGNGF